MKRSRLKPSRGTEWPIAESNAIYARDRGMCVGPLVGMPGACDGPSERDHVRASHGIGMKSESTRWNGVLLCSNVHHPMKTNAGKTWRPVLLAYLARFYPERLREYVDHAHVELVHGCSECDAIRMRAGGSQVLGL